MHVWTGWPADQHSKDGSHYVPTLPVRGEIVIRGVLETDDRVGAEILGETEGKSPVPRLWDRSDGGVADFPLEDPVWVGNRT